MSSRDAAQPTPFAGVLMSPWTDLAVTGESSITKADIDPALTAPALRTRARDYLGQLDPASAIVSPIYADLTGLPPLLIQAGSNEILLDDATRLAAKAAADNVVVILDITPGVPHVFQAFADLLDEGNQALDRAATFLHSHAGVPTEGRPDIQRTMPIRERATSPTPARRPANGRNDDGRSRRNDKDDPGRSRRGYRPPDSR